MQSLRVERENLICSVIASDRRERGNLILFPLLIPCPSLLTPDALRFLISFRILHFTFYFSHFFAFLALFISSHFLLLTSYFH